MKIVWTLQRPDRILSLHLQKTTDVIWGTAALSEPASVLLDVQTLLQPIGLTQSPPFSLTLTETTGRLNSSFSDLPNLKGTGKGCQHCGFGVLCNAVICHSILLRLLF